MKRQTLFTLLAILFVTPMMALAAGLVPCGGPGEDACQFCYTVTLINNVIGWLITVLTVVVAIVFVISGLRLVTSAGNTSVMQSAKNTITNTFIGFVIILAAWLLIDFAMKALLSGGEGELNAGPWNAIQCVEQPTSQIVEASQGLVNGGTIDSNCDIVFPGPPPVFDCSAQEAVCTAGGGVPAIDTSSPTSQRVSCTYPPTSYSGSCSAIADTSNPCHEAQANMIAAFGGRVSEASIICNKESGGAPIRSGSDLCCGANSGCSAVNGEPCAACNGAPSFSGGYFQINVLSEADKIPGCTPGAFFAANGNNSIQGDCVRRNARGVCTGWSCSITDTGMYNNCMRVTTDSALNFQIAGQLFSTRGFQPWANSANICSVPY